MKFQYNDGGREKAGYKGLTGDCVTRAVAIITGLPYQQVYDAMNEGTSTQHKQKGYSARTGIRTNTRWFSEYMEKLGFRWVATMQVGSGCTTHLREGELPMGRLVARCSGHLVAVIDGVIHDIYDPSREGTRCVYGYWILPVIEKTS